MLLEEEAKPVMTAEAPTGKTSIMMIMKDQGWQKSSMENGNRIFKICQ